MCLSRRIEAYLKPAVADFLHYFAGEADGAPGFEDEACKIHGRPTSAREYILEKTSFQQ